MIRRPTNRGHEIGRPMNRGQGSDSSERRMMHNWIYRRFGFVDCEVRSYQCNNRLTLSNEWSESVDDQSIIQRNGQNWAFEFEMNVKPNSEWTNKCYIMHWEPFIYAHATVFRGHESSIMNFHFIWKPYPCRYSPYLILSEGSRYPDGYLVWNHACSHDRSKVEIL